jgi:hypothetical protein
MIFYVFHLKQHTDGIGRNGTTSQQRRRCRAWTAGKIGSACLRYIIGAATKSECALVLHVKLIMCSPPFTAIITSVVVRSVRRRFTVGTTSICCVLARATLESRSARRCAAVGAAAVLGQCTCLWTADELSAVRRRLAIRTASVLGEGTSAPLVATTYA